MTGREAIYLLEQARDLGINLIDTARGYGLSEQRVGQFLKNRRHDVILSTKVGYDVPGTQDWTFEAVQGGIDQALQTKQTNHLDIVHLHSCSREILAQSDVIEALEQAKQAGKVRVIAYSGDREDWQYAIETKRFDSFQTSFNLFDQRVDQVLPTLLNHGVIAKRPIGNAPWRFTDRPVGQYVEPYWERALQLAYPLEESSWLETALRFTVFEPGITTAIIETSRPEHLALNQQLIERGPLPADRVSQLKERFSECDATFDYVSQT
jgi:aryl-alcohol dehydrogenase-like predicted oxidoreductase